MTIFQRAHDILAAKTNKALDAAEKPDEMLDLSYDQMLDHLTQVRRALVSVTASRKQIELQEQQLQHSADHLQEQAKAALALGKEDLAREALQRKVGARGLRMILEDLMLDLMYNLSAQRKLRDFVVTAEMVRNREINWTLLEKAG